MRALHIVGINLKLWLGLDTGSIANDNIARGLHRIGTLGIGGNINHTLKLTNCLAASNALHQRKAIAIRDIMIYPHADLHLLLAACDKCTAQRAVGIGAIQINRIIELAALNGNAYDAALATCLLTQFTTALRRSKRELHHTELGVWHKINNELRLPLVSMQHHDILLALLGNTALNLSGVHKQNGGRTVRESYLARREITIV